MANVELLLDGDAPERIDGAGNPAVAHDVPVAREECERDPGDVVLGRNVW
jgi:hypothetical protein